WFEPVTRTSPALVAAERKLFVHNCAHCHGFDATGDEGPDLHDVQTSDRYIVNLITRGMPHQMPSFAKKFSKDDDAALLAYVRSLEENQGT
ncbi:MAG TPA: cytochrome c, partial [Opitutaceae bacterium]|nr:cytochrome c [Opitutaceae bacterium]